MAEKKLKKLSKKKAEKSESTAQVIKESAGQIWLAGLGAFAKAQEEGGKIFEALVKEKIGSLGENLVVRRFERWELGESTENGSE